MRRMINGITDSIVCVLISCGVVAVTVDPVAWISAAITGALLVLWLTAVHAPATTATSLHGAERPPSPAVRTGTAATRRRRG